IAGTVERVGEGVRSVREGDRVLVWPLLTCGHCALCKQGRPLLCLNWRLIGLHVDGAYAEYVRVPEANVISIPQTVSFEQAATLPMAALTAYHGLVGVGQLQAGETVFMWGGSGGLGTFAVQIAKALGARIITTMGFEEKRERVEALGAD